MNEDTVARVFFGVCILIVIVGVFVLFVKLAAAGLRPVRKSYQAAVAKETRHGGPPSVIFPESPVARGLLFSTYGALALLTAASASGGSLEGFFVALLFAPLSLVIPVFIVAVVRYAAFRYPWERQQSRKNDTPG